MVGTFGMLDVIAILVIAAIVAGIILFSLMTECASAGIKTHFRFSLRTAMVVMTLLGVLFTVAATKVRRVNQQKKAVAWLDDIGGCVVYDYELDGKGKDAELPAPKWVVEMFGLDYFATVVSVSLVSADVADLSPLATLTHLEELLLDHTRVTDLSPISNLTKLKRLYLAGTPVSDLSPLAKLTKLEYLDLGFTEVDNLQPLANLTKLETLKLGDTHTADLGPLANLERLKTLQISYTEVSDLRPLALLKNLEILRLSFTEVSDLAPLVNLTNLKQIFPYGASITDEDIYKLKEALPLCEVYLDAPE